MANDSDDRKRSGYVLRWRCIEGSWIAHATPCTRETFDLLVRWASWTEYRTASGYMLQRGECLTSHAAIRKELAWQSGCRMIQYSADEMKWAFRVLKAQNMITTRKTQHGLIVCIVNFERYQIPSSGDEKDPILRTPHGHPIRHPNGHPTQNEEKGSVYAGEIGDEDTTDTPTDTQSAPLRAPHLSYIQELQELKESTSTPARDGSASPLAGEYQAAYEVFRAAHPDCQRVGYDAFVVKVRAFGGKPDLREAADAFARDMAGVQCLQVPLREFGKYIARAVRDREAVSTVANGTGDRGNFRKKRAAGPLYTDTDLAIPV